MTLPDAIPFDAPSTLGAVPAGPLAMIGIQELWPIALILLLLFGARKLPELARALGSSINQFKRGLDDSEGEPKQVEGGDTSKES